MSTRAHGGTRPSIARHEILRRFDQQRRMPQRARTPRRIADAGRATRRIVMKPQPTPTNRKVVEPNAADQLQLSVEMARDLGVLVEVRVLSWFPQLGHDRGEHMNKKRTHQSFGPSREQDAVDVCQL